MSGHLDHEEDVMDDSDARDRKGFCAEVALNPQSLVGSYFLAFAAGEPAWSGMVVGEPQAGVYLCQIDRYDNVATDVQRVIPMAKITDDDNEWLFFDTEEEMRLALCRYMLGADTARRVGL